jgi:hypothetical protein
MSGVSLPSWLLAVLELLQRLAVVEPVLPCPLAELAAAVVVAAVVVAAVVVAAVVVAAVVVMAEVAVTAGAVAAMTPVLTVAWLARVEDLSSVLTSIEGTIR